MDGSARQSRGTNWRTSRVHQSRVIARSNPRCGRYCGYAIGNGQHLGDGSQTTNANAIDLQRRLERTADMVAARWKPDFLSEHVWYLRKTFQWRRKPGSGFGFGGVEGSAPRAL